MDAIFANTGIMPGGNMSELKVTDWMGKVERSYEEAGLTPGVIANAVLYAISQPDHMNASDLVVRPSKEV